MTRRAPQAPDFSHGEDVKPDDVKEVAAVHADAGVVAYSDYGQDAVAEWIREFASPEHIIERLEASSLGLVAVDDQNNVVGSILIGSATRGSNVIGGLYVRDRGRGVGTSLLHEALGWLHCSGSERALKNTGLDVSVGTGGRTKWNRSRQSIPKSHTLDALCVGNVDDIGSVPNNILVVACTGRGKHQRTALNKYGFARSRLPRTKTHHGLRTGDLVRAVVPRGKHKGVHVGRVSVRSSGSVRMGKVDRISCKNCTVLQRADGYGYERKNEAPLIPVRKGGDERRDN